MESGGELEIGLTHMIDLVVMDVNKNKQIEVPKFSTFGGKKKTIKQEILMTEKEKWREHVLVLGFEFL